METKAQHRWSLSEATTQIANQSKTIYKQRSENEKMRKALKAISESNADMARIREMAIAALSPPNMLDPTTAGWK